MNIPFTSRVLTASALLSDRPVEVRTLIVASAVAAKGAFLYDGRDTATGERRVQLSASTPGFLLKRGCYVEVEAGATYVTVVYRVLPSSEPLGPVT
jgi:hypothetical protein